MFATNETKIGGLDEVGWGALAGPIISVVAVFRQSDLNLLPPGVRDSKKTSEAQRAMLYRPLCQAALDVGVGHAWPWEIDLMGALPSLQLSYQRALEDLCVAKPDLLIVDGSNRITSWKGKQQVEPKADVNHPQVSAASIIAKYYRDTLMGDLARKIKLLGLPDYNWLVNKGYGTPDHIEVIEKNGILTNDANHDLYLHRKRWCGKILSRAANGRKDGRRS
jgi:ribonuclease HII